MRRNTTGASEVDTVYNPMLASNNSTSITAANISYDSGLYWFKKTVTVSGNKLAFTQADTDVKYIRENGLVKINGSLYKVKKDSKTNTEVELIDSTGLDANPPSDATDAYFALALLSDNTKAEKGNGRNTTTFYPNTITGDDGETSGSTSSEEAIKVKATYDGTLTANYTQKSLIYFKNTLGWSSVYVNFYTNNYWGYNDDAEKGTGNSGVTNRNKTMTRIGETDVWYFDYGAASITPSAYVSFTEDIQQDGGGNGYQYFWKSGDGENVVYPTRYPDAKTADKASESGFKPMTPMFVPLASQTAMVMNNSGGGKANYYNYGYWTMYTAGTGYTLEVYNSAGNNLLKTATFASADELMPMRAVVDLEAGATYKFQLRRGGTGSDGAYYGHSGTMTYANHGQSTAWDMTNAPSFSMAGITTNAAGDYTFNLSYSADGSGNYRLRMAVDYPIAGGDYRLVYTDAKPTCKPSAIVPKVKKKKDKGLA